MDIRLGELKGIQGKEKEFFRRHGKGGGFSANVKSWLAPSANLKGGKHSAAALRSNLYRFYQAASINRQFILHELLPDHRLIVT